MNGVDEVSQLLGKFAADGEEARRQRDAMWNKLDEIGKNVISIGAKMELLAVQHASLDTVVKKEVMPTIEDMKAIKQRGIGALAVAGLFGGGVWAAIETIAKKIGA